MSAKYTAFTKCKKHGLILSEKIVKKNECYKNFKIVFDIFTLMPCEMILLSNVWYFWQELLDLVHPKLKIGCIISTSGKSELSMVQQIKGRLKESCHEGIMINFTCVIVMFAFWHYISTLIQNIPTTIATRMVTCQLKYVFYE